MSEKLNHPNLAPEVNAAINRSEEAWGFDLKDLPTGTFIAVTTRNTEYTLHRDRSGEWFIRGNAKYCPDFCHAHLHGCTFGGSMIKLGHLFEGGYLEFSLREGPQSGKTVTTSQIKTVRIL